MGNLHVGRFVFRTTRAPVQKDSGFVLVSFEQDFITLPTLNQFAHIKKPATWYSVNRKRIHLTVLQLHIYCYTKVICTRCTLTGFNLLKSVIFGDQEWKYLTDT